MIYLVRFHILQFRACSCFSFSGLCLKPQVLYRVQQQVNSVDSLHWLLSEHCDWLIDFYMYVTMSLSLVSVFHLHHRELAGTGKWNLYGRSMKCVILSGKANSRCLSLEVTVTTRNSYRGSFAPGARSKQPQLTVAALLLWGCHSSVVASMTNKPEITGLTHQLGSICCGVVLLGKAFTHMYTLLTQEKMGTWQRWLMWSITFQRHNRQREIVCSQGVEMFLEWTGPMTRGGGGMCSKSWENSLTWISGYKCLPLTIF